MFFRFLGVNAVKSTPAVPSPFFGVRHRIGVSKLTFWSRHFFHIFLVFLGVNGEKTILRHWRKRFLFRIYIGRPLPQVSNHFLGLFLSFFLHFLWSCSIFYKIYLKLSSRKYIFTRAGTFRKIRIILYFCLFWLLMIN